MPTIAQLREQALALLNMQSAQNVNAVLAAAIVAKNHGAPLSPSLTQQQLLDAAAYLVGQAKSDLEAITVNQWMQFLQNASGGLQSVVAGSGISVDDSDQLNPVISATGSGSGNIAIVDSGEFTVDWTAVFGGLTGALHGGQCFEAQFDVISGFSGPREPGDILLVWSADLSQAEGNGGTHVSKKLPITVGIRGSSETYSDWRVVFHTMPCPDTADLSPGFRPYDYHSSVTDSAAETYLFAVLRAVT